MSVPAFTSISEVVSHLNATGPDTNSNYTVYGLTDFRGFCSGAG